VQLKPHEGFSCTENTVPDMSHRILGEARQTHVGLEIDLTGQVAIVTGGGAGIGKGVAIELARAGADVVVAEEDPAKAEQAAEKVAAVGGRAVGVVCDVMDTDQVRAAVQRADDEFGRVDILVNNAGGVRGRAFLDQSEGSWRRHIDINLVSMFAAVHAAAPVMIRGGRGGSIVNVSSIEGTRAAPTFAVYAACKAGMLSFTRTMAVELAEHGIRVNCIAPDFTRTEGMGTTPGRTPEAVSDAPTPDGMARYVPLGRHGVPSECGELVAYLCSPLAAYVTGASIPIDGGTWASSGWVRTPSNTWSLFPGFSTGENAS
jgi:NAD(P)-dependent dehydrogenase (short-subunit alcohol dehydrogenase family)